MEESCNRVLYTLIDRKIIKMKDVIDRPVLDGIKKWFKRIVMRWLKKLLDIDNHRSPSELDIKTQNIMDQWKTKLEFYINDSFARMRCHNLFDLTINMADASWTEEQ